MTNPEQIQEEIERTRATLSADVDRLTEKVSPPRVVGRQVDRVKTGAVGLKDRVMGSADDSSGLRGAGDSLGSAAGSAKDALGSAPDAVRSQARGNPLGAGLVAFGVGMVIAALLPPTQAEQQLAAQAEAKAKDLAEPVKQAGQQLAEDLKPAAKQAVDEVKSTAQDAAQQTTEQARSAADDVKAPLQR
jgi:gas vesicle protein